MSTRMKIINAIEEIAAAQKKKLAPLYDEFQKKQGAKGEKFLADLNAALATH